MPSPSPKQPVRPSPVVPSPVATPAPSARKPSNADSPTMKPYVPSDSKPYKPSDSESKSEPKKKKSHWFRNFLLLCLIGGGGYYYYKRRFDSFNFVQYRRSRMFGYSPAPVGESEMYSSLNNSTTFEPPSLPPTPMSMGPMGMSMPQGMDFQGGMQGMQGMQMT